MPLQKGGYGLGGAARHRKVIRDAILQIKKPEIRRIYLLAGIKSVSNQYQNSGYEITRGYLVDFARKVLKRSIAIMEHSKRKTLQYDDVVSAFTLLNISIIGLPTDGKFKGNTSEELQAEGNCHFFARICFERVIREVGQDYHIDINYSAVALQAIQFATESYLLRIAKNAKSILKAAKRETVTQSDISKAANTIVLARAPFPLHVSNNEQELLAVAFPLAFQTLNGYRVDDDGRLAAGGCVVFKQMIMFVLSLLLSTANFLSSGKIKLHDIQTSVRLMLPGEIGKYAVSKGVQAVVRFNDNPKPIPYKEFAEFLKQYTERSERTADTRARVYLGAVLDYIGNEILEVATNNKKRNRETGNITDRNLTDVIRNDEEFEELFASAFVSGIF